MPYVIGGAILGGAVLQGSQQQAAAGTSIKFQREMARKAHQYEVEDLRRAGLNPILSGTGGPGAKATGGAIAQVPDYAATATQVAKIHAEIANIEANTALVDAKEGQERVGGQIGRDLDAAYGVIKGAATAIDVKRNYLELQRGTGKTSKEMQEIIDKAEKKGKKGKKRTDHIGHKHLHINVQGKKR